jgi:hypothetical protein
MTNIFGNKVPGLLLRGLIRGCLALVFGRNQAACAVEVGREPLFARYDGLQAGSVLDRWFLSLILSLNFRTGLLPLMAHFRA